MEARSPDGDTLSVLLQNAETVKLIGPAPAGPAAAAGAAAAAAAVEPGAADQQQQQQQQQAASAEGSSPASQAAAAPAPPEAAVGAGGGWRAIPVSSLKEGDLVYVVLQHAARHTGLAIQEKVKEV